MIITILINNLMIMTINNLMMKTMIRDEDLADALLWHLSQSDHFGGEQLHHYYRHNPRHL